MEVFKKRAILKRKGLITSILVLILGLTLYIGAVHETEAATVSSSASVTNVVPSASSASLNGASDVTLSANANKTISATVTITDNNGCEDVDTVNATLYDTFEAVSNSPSNLRNRTINTSCSSNSDCTAGGSDLTVTYTCNFTMVHFANPTDAGSNHSTGIWTVNVTPYDEATGTSTTATQEINTLTAFTATSSLAFGELALDADTGSTNTNATVTNTGNEQLDMQLDAFGNTDGDGFAMNCSLGNVTVSLMQYSSQTFLYNKTSNVAADGINMTDTATELNLDVAQGSEATRAPIEDIAFGFGLPLTGVGGSCSGTVTVTAKSDPHKD